jgi:hypothetical protein
MKKSRCYRIWFGICVLASSSFASGLRLDLNPVTDRKDVLTPGWANWAVKEGMRSSESFGKITVTLRKAGRVGSGLAGFMWKGGYDTGATVASDGVTVKDGDKGGAFELCSPACRQVGIVS